MEKLPVPAQPWVIVIGFDTIAKRLIGNVTNCSGIGLMNSVPQSGERPEANPSLAGPHGNHGGPGLDLTFKANLLSRRDGGLLPLAEIQGGQAAPPGSCGQWIVPGILTRNWEPAKAFIDRALNEASSSGQSRAAQVPPAWKKLSRCGERREAIPGLMRAVKNKLDPIGVFNPRRFVDGI